MKPERKKDYWDKLDIVFKFSALVVVAIIGGCYNSAIKERETDAKMVEVAIGILKAKPDEFSAPLRDWAIETVNKCSKIRLNDEAARVLRTNALPEGKYLADEEGNAITDEKGHRIIVE